MKSVDDAGADGQHISTYPTLYIQPPPKWTPEHHPAARKGNQSSDAVAGAVGFAEGVGWLVVRLDGEGPGAVGLAEGVGWLVGGTTG